mmetsp:Transcript_38973/g.85673  ORF Transcript_38973/g.85673 Transcript_38973/m.85673 type:complete len:289 (+) Transcript_38973:294-1160(+)
MVVERLARRLRARAALERVLRHDLPLEAQHAQRAENLEHHVRRRHRALHAEVPAALQMLGGGALRGVVDGGRQRAHAVPRGGDVYLGRARRGGLLLRAGGRRLRRVHDGRAAEQLPPLVVEDEVVGDRHLVAVLLLQRLQEILAVEADLHHNLHEHVLVDEAELRHDLVGRHREVERQVVDEPAVPPDLRDGDPLQRVDDEHARDEVFDVVGHVAGQREDAALDLLEEVGDVLVVKGERAAEQRVEDHATRPDVNLGARVELAGNHLGRRVVGRAAARLEKVAVLHDV